VENGATWRFFKGQSAIFALLAADGPGSEPASLASFTSVESGRLEPPPTRLFSNEAPFFTDQGTYQHVQDRREFTIVLILSRAFEARIVSPKAGTFRIEGVSFSVA
jgi:hypothetical protein